MCTTEIDAKMYRADFDQLTQSLYETTSRERAVWNEVKKVCAIVDCDTDVIKNTIEPALWVIVCPASKVIKEFPIKIPSLPLVQCR
jgi:hypothetical protein